MVEPPIACTLSLGELLSRRKNLLPGVIALAQTREPVEGGYRWRFAPSPEMLGSMASMISVERRCCPFLRFTVQAEAGEGPVWLRVTGPEGTREFLDQLGAM